MKTIATVMLAYVIASATVYAALDIAGLQMMVGIYSNGVVVSTMPAAAPASLWWVAFNIATCIAALGALVALSRKHRVINQTVHFNVAADADADAIVAAFRRTMPTAPSAVGERDNGDPARKSPGA